MAFYGKIYGAQESQIVLELDKDHLRFLIDEAKRINHPAIYVFLDTLFFVKKNRENYNMNFSGEHEQYKIKYAAEAIGLISYRAYLKLRNLERSESILDYYIIYFQQRLANLYKPEGLERCETLFQEVQNEPENYFYRRINENIENTHISIKAEDYTKLAIIMEKITPKNSFLSNVKLHYEKEVLMFSILRRFNYLKSLKPVPSKEMSKLFSLFVAVAKSHRSVKSVEGPTNSLKQLLNALESQNLEHLSQEIKNLDKSANSGEIQAIELVAITKPNNR